MRLYEQTELTEAINGRSNSVNNLVEKAGEQKPTGKTKDNIKWN